MRAPSLAAPVSIRKVYILVSELRRDFHLILIEDFYFTLDFEYNRSAVCDDFHLPSQQLRQLGLSIINISPTTTRIMSTWFMNVIPSEFRRIFTFLRVCYVQDKPCKANFATSERFDGAAFITSVEIHERKSSFTKPLTRLPSSGFSFVLQLDEAISDFAPDTTLQIFVDKRYLRTISLFPRIVLVSGRSCFSLQFIKWQAQQNYFTKSYSQRIC